MTETYYLTDPTERHQYAQAFPTQATQSRSMQRVSFWTTPDGGGRGQHEAYPFTVEDFFPAIGKCQAPPAYVEGSTSDEFCDVTNFCVSGCHSRLRASWSLAAAIPVAAVPRRTAAKFRILSLFCRPRLLLCPD